MAERKLRAHALLLSALLLVPLVASAGRDGDGIPDEDDPFPDNVTRAVGLLEGKRLVVGDRVGKRREDVVLTFHFFKHQRFAVCEGVCRFGDYERMKKGSRKFRLKLDPADRRALVDDLEAFVEQGLFEKKNLVHDVSISLGGVREIMAVVSKNGRRLRFALLLEHDAKVRMPKKKPRVDGKLKIRASGPFSGF